MPGNASAEVSESARVLVCPGHEQTVRWQHSQRLPDLYEECCDRLRESGRGDQLAVDAGDIVLSYDELDQRANQLARYLLALGARPGDRIGLLFDYAPYAYVGMLAVLKINAAYVPLDVGYPLDRLSYIVRDSGVRLVLSLSQVRDRFADLDARLLCVDEVADLLDTHDPDRLTAAERGEPVDDLCYVIYTSGTTGRPKGVAIQHASICNFVRVAAEVYGLRPQDRVYQGMTIAFDFSVEEIWVPWLAGATLVPKPGSSSLLGHELWEFLHANAVTALCCVPTLLATIDEDLPELRFLLVSGEACPQDLITRWHRPGRRFLNVYGPTEATVTATWSSVHPDSPVTLGVPLPTYSVVILDPVEERALSAGELGEIGIAGIGLATGYLNREDLTARVFIKDFIGIANNPSGRIYRTGDLGRVNGEGEIEYHGRIDTQVKIRGFRIELTEIESVLLQVPGIAQAVVDTYQPEPDLVELVAYYSPREGADRIDQQEILDHLRGRLPGYMVPAYFEQLVVIPMTTNNKADRKNLPAPQGRRTVATQQNLRAPQTDTERVLAGILAEVVRLDQVSTDHHFFDDLGANSLLMARFCAQVRKRTELPSVSMRDVYLHPTVTGLAAALDAVVPSTTQSEPTEPVVVASTARYVLCGLMQALFFLAYSYLSAVIIVEGSQWISTATGLVEGYLRALAFGGVAFVGLCTLPVLAKWLLIGRWKRQEIPVWSLAYLRFWIVKTLTRSNPMVLFAGSPLYSLYLRAMGAKVGRGAAVFTRNVPCCADLLTIGAGAVIRKDSFLNCYRARGGLIQTGRVSIGAGALVSEATVLDIETSLGDRAQLGHASSLPAGTAVPAGERWHGSPAERTEVNYQTVDPARCGAARRAVYGSMQLLTMLVFYVPLTMAIMGGLLPDVLPLATVDFTSWAFYRDHLAASSLLFFGAVVGGLVLVVSVPRLANLVVKPDRVYPLYGLHYSLQRAVARLTNLRFFTYLFGDSSYIVYYLRAIGYDLSRVEQSGSNFGVSVKHESPYLSQVGRGTMVSDGLSMINAEFSSSSFRASPARIGERNFLGNAIAYPARSRTGDNCLLATKVMVPVDGPVRQDVGLLGSPAFEIPRTVERDRSFDHLKTGTELRRRLAAKLRHNTVTLGVYLLVTWLHFVAITLLGVGISTLYPQFGISAVAFGTVVTFVVSVAYFVLVERLATGFMALRPRFCSIYDRYFWGHERFWKLSAGTYLRAFNGTPYKNLLWRLLGVRIGRKVFDDGCAMPEKTLVTIGSNCTLNAGSVVQCHSLEDGTFKSDHTVVGAGSTLGVGAFVHYGVTMGEGAQLEADSFLMKGSELVPNARWAGNPATELRP